MPAPAELLREFGSFSALWTASEQELILAHNHPSGVAEPSHADETLTQALRQALVEISRAKNQ